MQLSFTAVDYAKDGQYRSDAKTDGPPEMKLEDYVQRMAWIKKTGKLFDKLMRDQFEYMNGELHQIAEMGGLT
ncbi:hypothetical protein F4827_000832 [Paraburkholderia bannensis]|uniref:Uncharacterized protein n=1 Tax=Paraburkholderia bannensis TaxID=765414 RepID=A0A7W9WR79_9BURK|nr:MULTISPECIES: hypothetical protein [Paraburkholderia]MBB3256006.1 hypothetical protein [Paraburkholderia sp. WP4_3_2]MBB6101006.1 hypothetical protein [Paraburkholderia bannensis]